MSIGMGHEIQPVPLTKSQDGTWYVGATPIPFERVIECHQAGLSPESIVEHFDSLRLSDVYLVIGYYLDNKEVVEAYLARQEADAEAVRRRIEARQPQRPGLRAELLARRARMETPNAPVGDGR